MSRWLLDTGWQGLRTRLTIGLDPQRAAWYWPGDPTLHACPLADLSSALPPERLYHVDLVAAPALAVHWMQQAPRATASLDELRRVALARCLRLFGGDATHWRITGDWRLDRPFICAALPEFAVACVELALQGRALRWQWHCAWQLLCADRAHQLPGEGWAALRSPQRLMLWHCHDHQVDRIASLPTCPEEPGPALLARALDHIHIEGIRMHGIRPDPGPNPNPNRDHDHNQNHTDNRAAHGASATLPWQPPSAPNVHWIDLCATPSGHGPGRHAALAGGQVHCVHEAAAALAVAVAGLARDPE